MRRMILPDRAALGTMHGKAAAPESFAIPRSFPDRLSHIDYHTESAETTPYNIRVWAVPLGAAGCFPHMKWLKPAQFDRKSGTAMQEVLLVVHLIIALGLIGVVLLQRSEGGALGIGGGGGGGGNLFSARGVGNALTRTTAYLALAFFATSIALTVLATQRGGGSVIDSVTPPASSNGTAPAQGTDTGGVLPNLAPATP